MGMPYGRTRAVPAPAGMNRRFVVLVVLFLAFVSVLYLGSFRDSTSNEPTLRRLPDRETLTGGAIAPKLGNETAKAELGRAAWRVLHTTFARFPEEPTKDESDALLAYVHLFQRLYPCGECAQHFGALLEKYPPQVSSRNSAAAWGCHIHNQVNKSLKKDLFDCSKIGDFYDCGCADEEEDSIESPSSKSKADADPEGEGRISWDKEDYQHG